STAAPMAVVVPPVPSAIPVAAVAPAPETTPGMVAWRQQPGTRVLVGATIGLVSALFLTGADEFLVLPKSEGIVFLLLLIARGFFAGGGAAVGRAWAVPERPATQGRSTVAAVGLLLLLSGPTVALLGSFVHPVGPWARSPDYAPLIFLMLA